jgi:hypothetical protein
LGDDLEEFFLGGILEFLEVWLFILLSHILIRRIFFWLSLSSKFGDFAFRTNSITNLTDTEVASDMIATVDPKSLVRLNLVARNAT